MPDQNIPAPPSGTAVPVSQDANTPPPPPSGTAVPVPGTTAPDKGAEPGLLDKFAAPPTQGDFESAMQQGGMAPTMYGLSNIRSGVGQAVKGAVDTFTPKIQEGENALTANPVARMVKGVLHSGGQLGQVPAAIKDIAASPDPLGTTAKALGDTSGQLGGAGAAALAIEGAIKLPSALRTALSKSGVTSEMAGKLSTSLDTVAKDAGLPKSSETSLSGKVADTVKGLKGQAQKIYGDLDKASGGRYQRFVDEIDTIEDAMKNKYTSPQDAIKLKNQLSQVKADYAATQKQLVAQGIDPKTIAQADVKWAQAKALETVGKKFKTAESLSGELKPGTSSVDTGLKNLKPHILKQATKGEASGITDTVVDATNKLSKVKRNQAIAKVAGAAVGLGGVGALAHGLSK